MKHMIRTNTLILAILGTTYTVCQAAITPSGGGLTLVQQGPTGNPVPSNLATLSGTAFSDGALVPAGIHDTPNLRDGIYGNSNSWISDGDGDGWAGISFGSSQTLAAIAFGRDNLGSFGDRTLGTYTLEYRNDGSTANDAGWLLIGTIAYSAPAGLVIGSSALDSFPSQRHAFNFTTVPAATAVRLVVPGGAADTAIDEIELYAAALSPVPPAVTPTITWDGNDGANFNGPVPNNLALAANGGTPFSDGELGFGHMTVKLNDGTYGNSASWISDDTDATSFAGIDLANSGPGGGLYALTSIAFGRDNRDIANGDNYDGNDRNLGAYTLQYTTLTNAGAGTADTQDPATGWADIGSFNYASDIDDVTGGNFTGRFRHEYQIGAIGGGPIVAGAIRIIAPNGNAIDEIEIYGIAVPEPTTFSLCVIGIAAGFAFGRGRRQPPSGRTSRSVR